MAPLPFPDFRHFRLAARGCQMSEVITKEVIDDAMLNYTIRPLGSAMQPQQDQIVPAAVLERRIRV